MNVNRKLIIISMVVLISLILVGAIVILPLYIEDSVMIKSELNKESGENIYTATINGRGEYPLRMAFPEYISSFVTPDNKVYLFRARPCVECCAGNQLYICTLSSELSNQIPASLSENIYLSKNLTFTKGSCRLLNKDSLENELRREKNNKSRDPFDLLDEFDSRFENSGKLYNDFKIPVGISNEAFHFHNAVIEDECRKGADSILYSTSYTYYGEVLPDIFGVITFFNNLHYNLSGIQYFGTTELYYLDSDNEFKKRSFNYTYRQNEVEFQLKKGKCKLLPKESDSFEVHENPKLKEIPDLYIYSYR